MIGAGDDDLWVEVEVRVRSDVGGDQVLVHIEKYLTLIGWGFDSLAAHKSPSHNLLVTRRFVRREGIEPPTNECQVLLDVYQDLIAANITSNPDLNFDPQIIIASADHVACRLSSSAQRSTNFWDTPRTANGSAFAEHVFDRFPDGRI